MLKLTMQLATVTLTSDPLTLKLVHGVLVSQGPFLTSSVFVGLFFFPLGGGTGQTDRQTDGQNQHMMGDPSTKDGHIITEHICGKAYLVAPLASGFYHPKSGIKIGRNFPHPQFWAQVPPPISDSSFPLHFRLLPTIGRVLLRVYIEQQGGGKK